MTPNCKAMIRTRLGSAGAAVAQLVDPAVGDVKLEDMSNRLERTGMKVSDVVSSLKCLIAVGLTAGALACSHARSASAGATTKSDEAATVKAAPSSPGPQPAGTPPAPVLLQADSIYFGFDKSDLDRGSEDVLSRVGGVLAANPELHMRVEGNCDERGTEEYNLLLGQRRADAAKSYLVRMGANPGQLETASYGKEHPRATGHDEAAWRQNRRDDLIPNRDVIPAKPVAVSQ